MFLIIEVNPEERITPIQNKALNSLLEQFQDVFEEPKGLPPPREFGHAIPFIQKEATVNIRSYWYSFFQKNEIEKQVHEMLQDSII